MWKRIACWFIGHAWSTEPPPKDVQQSCFKQGGFALLFLPFMGTTTCKRCGRERD
jgi:hypothetical protein